LEKAGRKSFSQKKIKNMSNPDFRFTGNLYVYFLVMFIFLQENKYDQFSCFQKHFIKHELLKNGIITLNSF